jgi:hypothetical protein
MLSRSIVFSVVDIIETLFSGIDRGGAKAAIGLRRKV